MNLASFSSISLVGIYLALSCIQNAVKPLLCLRPHRTEQSGRDRACDHGHAIRVHGILGVASLIGVIVSHVIVLFDFIEEDARERRTTRTCSSRCRH